VTEEAQDFGDFGDIDAELGFEPAASSTGADDAPRARKAPRRRTRLVRRKLSAFAVLVGALTAIGGGYAVFASSSGAAESTGEAASISEGEQLFNQTCISCHGQNLQGIKGRAPSLIGVGGAAVYFQVSTGRMPLARQGAYAPRKPPKYDDQETRDIAAYVQSIGGGPAIPAGTLKGNDSTIADGGELFRLNCAQCHGTTGKGAPLSAGKVIPSLNSATDMQMYTAMLSGPENMPVFSDNTLTPKEKQAIIAYVQTLKASKDPGGSGIGRIGPVSEAVVCWVVGIGLLMIAILWIGAKAQ
jgi:ubiquinol-cytochrome c reductase cytochrome c subunit